MLFWLIWGVAVLLTACRTVEPQAASVVSTPMCADDSIPVSSNALPDYVPSTTTTFVSIQEGHFVVGSTPFIARGINYYPSRYPWRRFLTESDLKEVNNELALMRATGLNTLRLFLWNEALFTCPGSGAVPIPEAFLKLDAIIQSAGQQGFRLIVTLNDMPDLTNNPLYTNPSYIIEQTRFIVERYRDEAAILAWDLRNEGDIDYGTHPAFPAKFPKQTVLDWLSDTAESVRILDQHHLITAGWLNDNEASAPYVDFVSFHHWEDTVRLQERIANLQSQTDKPILLEEFGYSTFRFTADEQSRMISEVVDAVEAQGLLGWLIWTAFDFPLDATCTPPACPSQDNAEHHFGLWTTDYTPKPAVEFLKTRLRGS